MITPDCSNTDLISTGRFYQTHFADLHQVVFLIMTWLSKLPVITIFGASLKNICIQMFFLGGESKSSCRLMFPHIQENELNQFLAVSCTDF